MSKLDESYSELKFDLLKNFKKIESKYEGPLSKSFSDYGSVDEISSRFDSQVKAAAENKKIYEARKKRLE